jgi:arsenate reductase
MPDLIIYHNGECSKSKGALEILIEQGVPHTVRWYLADPLSRAELQALLAKLGMQPSQVVRRNEDLYRQQYEHADVSEEEWLTILTEHPGLIERPIIERGDKAIVARPPERVFEMV